MLIRTRYAWKDTCLAVASSSTCDLEVIALNGSLLNRLAKQASMQKKSATIRLATESLN